VNIFQDLKSVAIFAYRRIIKNLTFQFHTLKVTISFHL